jgi:hypothetical protein
VYTSGSGSGSGTRTSSGSGTVYTSGSGSYDSGSGYYVPGSGSYDSGSGYYVPGSSSGSGTVYDSDTGSYVPGSSVHGSGSGSYVPGSSDKSATLYVNSVNVYDRATGKQTQPNTSIVIPQTNKLSYWTHSSVNSQPSANNTTTLIYYFAWNTDTYLHTMVGQTNSSKLTNYSTTRINGDGSGSAQGTSYTLNYVTPTSQPAGGINPSNTYTTFSGYPNQVYMITNNVGFDIANANLILTNLAGAVPVVINRDGNVASSADMNATSIPAKSAFTPFMKAIDTNNNLVLYMQGPNGNTLIVILNSDLTIFSVTGFTPKGLWVQGQSFADSGSSFTSGFPSSDSLGSGVSGNEGSYAYWLAYWNSISGQSNPTYSEDYLLKTQVVPPVCPTCPGCNGSACNGGGTCANCGGNGGGGTLIGSGQAGIGSQPGAPQTGSNLTTSNLINNIATDATLLAGGAGLGAYSLADKSLNMVGQGVGGAANLVGKGVGGAVDLTKQGVTGTVGLAKETVGGAVDLTKQAVTGTVGLAKETVGGAVGLLREAGAGVKDILTVDGPNGGQGQAGYNGGYNGGYNAGYNGGQGQPSQVGYSAGQNQSQVSGQAGQNGGYGMVNAPKYNTAGADPYSYYGALTSRGDSNYIPVTANFSAFSK